MSRRAAAIIFVLVLTLAGFTLLARSLGTDDGTARGDASARAALPASLQVPAGDDAPEYGPNGSNAREDTGGPAPAAREPDSLNARSFFLALDGEGLRLFESTTGSSRPLPFETDGEVVRAALTAVLGKAPVDEGFSEDCAAEYLRWRDSVTIWIVRDRFVGWSLGDSSSKLTTPAGVGIGSTREELEDAYVAEVSRSTLGVEFTAGGLAGLLDSAGNDARITHLWSGRTCIAR